jgi:hypothetical protein
MIQTAGSHILTVDRVQVLRRLSAENEHITVAFYDGIVSKMRAMLLHDCSVENLAMTLLISWKAISCRGLKYTSVCDEQSCYHLAHFSTECSTDLSG